MDGVIAAKKIGTSETVLQKIAGSRFVLWRFFRKPDWFRNIGALDYGRPLSLNENEVEELIQKENLVRC